MAKGKTSDATAREILARNLRGHRRRLSISQERLAALASLHYNYVGSVERAERNISIDNIEKLAAALGVSVSSLLAPTRKGAR